MNQRNNIIYALEKTNLDYLNNFHVQKSQKKLTLKIFLNKIRIHFNLIKNKKKYAELSTKTNDLCWTEKEWKQYLSLKEGKKIVVYTCITDGYDNVNEPYFLSDKIKYICYSDKKIDSNIWEYRPLPAKLEIYSSRDKNRYMKMHPMEFFEGYDYAIYIDGNVKIISDMSGLINALNNKIGLGMHLHVERDCIYKEGLICQLFRKGNYKKINAQLENYKREGFPEEYGMCECTIIISDINNEYAKSILENWWKEYLYSLSGRDQLALPYVLWKNNIKIQDIGTLGNNLYKNPKFRVYTH